MPGFVTARAVPRVAAAALIAGALLAGPLVTAASAYPASVVAKCRGDHKRLCPQYKKLGDELDSCMRANFRSISNSCMNTLVDAGIAPAAARRR